MSFTQKDRVEIEELMQGFARPVASSVMPRWQRKALASSMPSVRSATEGAAVDAVAAGAGVGAGAGAVVDVDLTAGMSKATNPSTPATKRTRCTSTPSKTPSTKAADRFIPTRKAMNFDMSHLSLTEEAATTGGDYQRKLASGMLASGDGEEDSAAATAAAESGDAGADPHRVLAFKAKPPTPSAGHMSATRVLYSQNRDAVSRKRARVHRHIPSDAERILDAPELLDDYYLNLLDWSSTNVLGVALGQTVYMWNATTGCIDELMTTPGEADYVSSLSWIEQGNILAVGTGDGATQLWDVEKKKCLRTMRGHSARVSSMDWNKHILSTGSRDSTIVHHDVRQRDHHIATLRRHEQEVCGLKWSPDGKFLASGGNDNLLCVWDVATTTSASADLAPRHCLTQHNAAVKALAWCPWQRNTLASGGGTADRTIKFWNASNGALLNSIDTGSQVCSLLWSTHEREILSSHGYSRNQLCLWKYPSMTKIKELEGHSARVLHLAASPDGAHVCSAAADETLRFWNVFGEKRKNVEGKSKSKAMLRSRKKALNIR